jgi:hypothetical protein
VSSQNKPSRTPAGKPTIRCPECGDWVPLERGVGAPPHRVYTCVNGHHFGLAGSDGSDGDHDDGDKDEDDRPGDKNGGSGPRA